MIRETAHTITILPESSGAPKTVSKRDVAVATKEQKDKVEKSGRRRATLIESTTSSSENEEPSRKKTKKKSRQVPEMAFDFEETRPPVVESSSTSTGVGEEKESGVKQEVEKTSSSGNEQIPQSAQIPVRATTSWDVNTNPRKKTSPYKKIWDRRHHEGAEHEE